MSTVTHEQVKEVIQMARDRAIGIKASCYCHALSTNRQPCVACESFDIIVALCNVVQSADEAMDRTNKLVKDFADNIKKFLGAEEVK